VDVPAAVSRHGEQVRRQDAAVGDDHHEIEIERAQHVDEGRLAQPSRLGDRQPGAERRLLDRRRRLHPPAAGRTLSGWVTTSRTSAHASSTSRLGTANAR